MSGILTDAGALEILNAIFGEEETPTSFELMLYTTTITQGDKTTSANIVEATGGYPGMKTMQLSAATAALSGVEPSAIPEVTWKGPRDVGVADGYEFKFTGAPAANTPTIKGYAVISSSGTLLFFENITEWAHENDGDKLIIIPKFRLGNGTPT